MRFKKLVITWSVITDDQFTLSRLFLTYLLIVHFNECFQAFNVSCTYLWLKKNVRKRIRSNIYGAFDVSWSDPYVHVIMWPAKKNTIKVYFVLTDGETDIENASEKMLLAYQVRDDEILIGSSTVFWEKTITFTMIVF